ncbi:MAG: 16S rRNA (uracil(1498)-N(3))-methyltransferase [Chitinophagaceae bacterium]|nr:16S rRNA (uracil(1498)-N(3))-methyltransferase [Chitinophagaceae bacterium]
MQLPYFFLESSGRVDESISLAEETSKHIVSVLRMAKGDRLHLTDGKGHLITAEIDSAHKKHCIVKVIEVSSVARHGSAVSIAISLLKNNSRFEWFLEKCTEIGVSTIRPLLCDRTERQHFRKDRMQGILVSAMLQSRQSWLPELLDPLKFDEYAVQEQDALRFIAHCDDVMKSALTAQTRAGKMEIAIGPEGDFTADEISIALAKGFIPVSLGENRLRSETAGVVAATLLCIAR